MQNHEDTLEQLAGHHSNSTVAEGSQLTCLTRPQHYRLSARCHPLFAAVITICSILKAAFYIIHTKGLLLRLTEQQKFLLLKKTPAAEQESVRSPSGNPRTPFGEAFNSPRALSGNSRARPGHGVQIVLLLTLPYAHFALIHKMQICKWMKR